MSRVDLLPSEQTLLKQREETLPKFWFKEEST